MWREGGREGTVTQRPHDMTLTQGMTVKIARQISFAEHGKLVAESSEFHFTLSRAHFSKFYNLSLREKNRHCVWLSSFRT